MQPIGGITRTTATAAGPVARVRRPAPNPDAGALAEGGRALIAVAPAAGSDLPPTISRRPSASFLAHLIATAEQAPQTRARRRADPQLAISIYRSAAADVAPPAGHRLVRSC
jgi:hypothetical protein